MKKIIILNIAFVSSLLFTGCGGGSSPLSSRQDLGINTRMEKNKAYEVNEGDKVEKISDNPEIKVDSDLDSGKTTVTLISGEAAIIKN